MIHPDTLETVRQAFHRVKTEQGFSAWGIDSEITGGIVSDKTSADRVIIHLINDASERTSIHIEILDVVKRKGSVTVEGVAEEIKRTLQGRGLISYD